MFTITLEYATIEEAITAMATLRNPETAPQPVKETKLGKSVTTAPSAGGKQDAADGPKDAPAKKAVASSASETVVEKPAAAKPDAESDPYTPVGALIKKLVATHRAQVLAVLSEFGVPNGKELKPTQYASFMEKLTAATAPDLA